MGTFSKTFAGFALALASAYAFAQAPASKAPAVTKSDDSAIEARDNVLAVCKAIKEMRESVTGSKVSPADRAEKLAEAAEMQRRLGLPCGSSSAVSSAGGKSSAHVQAEHDLAEARKVLASRAAAQAPASVASDTLAACETKSRHVFIGNDGRMVATCKGAADEVYRAPPPPTPQQIVIAPAIMHQLGQPVAVATPVSAQASAQASAGSGAATAGATASASASAPAVPGNISGRGTIRFQNPITGKTETGTVNSPQEAMAWLLERQAACTAELRRQPGINPDASCKADKIN